MNTSKVKKQSDSKKLKEIESLRLRGIANSVGDFIRYWGFRRIHGQLWTQIFLSRVPLSGSDLARMLKVSKSLVSPALSELMEYGLIWGTGVDRKTKRYSAYPDVHRVICNILKTREASLIEASRKKHESLFKISDSLKDGTSIDRSRLDFLGEMIVAAAFSIELIIHSTEQEALSQLNQLSDAGVH